MRLCLSPSRDEEEDPESQAALDRLGLDILRLRARSGLSQRRLGALARVDQGTISRFERGLAPGVAITSVARIIMALDGHVLRLSPALEAWARLGMMVHAPSPPEEVPDLAGSDPPSRAR
jgi:transcriptional regulator with XRE-family HTH domain